MPKSRLRKGRRQYRPKGTGLYGIPNPGDLFIALGSGGMDEEEEQYAARLLLANMDNTAEGATTLRNALGDMWPPKDADDLIRIAKLVVNEPSYTPGTPHASNRPQGSTEG